MRNAKKILAVLIAALMLLTMAACGGKPAGNDTPNPPTNSNTPTPTNKPNNETTPNTPVTGEALDLELFSLTYDSEVWTYEEDDLYDDESYSKIMMIIPDGEDSYTVNLEVRVSVEDAESFRDYLESYGFDAYAYAVNNAYELVNIGGVDCLKQEGNYWGEACLRYIGRDEAASATVFIEIIGDYESEQVSAVLSTLAIQVEDIGNEDFPWPWEGEPFAAANHSEMAGTYTVDSQWLELSECIVTGETFDHSVAVIGDTVYILSEGILRRYTLGTFGLELESELELGDDYDMLQSTSDGTLWVSGSFAELLTYKDGVQTGAYDDVDSVAMHPDGQWGITWFSGPDCEKLTFSGGTVSSAAITFGEVSTISEVLVDEDYIYVCGYAADDSGHKVFLYDHSGKLVMTLTDDEGDCLGSVTFIAQTDYGFLAMDGNMREVVLWTEDGTWIGTIEDSDLFETDYPWFCGGALCADGSILVIMTEDRQDESAMELVAFLLETY